MAAAVLGLIRIRTTALCSIFCKKTVCVLRSDSSGQTAAPRLAFVRAAVVPGGENPGVNPGMTNPNGMNPGGAYAGMPNANGMNPGGAYAGVPNANEMNPGAAAETERRWQRIWHCIAHTWNRVCVAVLYLHQLGDGNSGDYFRNHSDHKK